MEKKNKKSPSASCLFCVNSSSSVKKFKISEDSGGGNTIRHDLKSFLGRKIKPYLKDDDLLCSNCMNFFENMAYTKRRLIRFLRDRDEAADTKMQVFNDIWKGFTDFAVTLVKLNPSDTEETWDPELNRCHTPNPLVHTHSEPYNHAFERKFSERGQFRSGSLAPSESSSDADSEIRRLIKRSKRKRRGHNWSKRKGEQKSRALSRIYPDNSYVDDDNYRNCYSTLSGERLRYDEDTLSEASTKHHSSRRKYRSIDGKPLKTRSVSRLEVYFANATAERESQKFYCSDVNCTVYFENLDNLVLHKVYDHNIIARFKCSLCTNIFTTNEELTIHNRIHDTEILHCFQCKLECKGTENLQAHLRDHQKYSIECKFCYLSFLTKPELAEHCATEHKGSKKKVHEKISSIFRTIVNKDKITGNNVNNNNKGEKEFESRILNVEKTPSPIRTPQIPDIAESVVVTSGMDTEAIVTPEGALCSTSISIEDSPPISISDATKSNSSRPISGISILDDMIIRKETPNEVVSLSSDNSPDSQRIVLEDSFMEPGENSEHSVPMDIDNVFNSGNQNDLLFNQLLYNPQLNYFKPVVVLNRFHI